MFDGVFDAINEIIGRVGASGFPIFHTDEMLLRAKTIFTSTGWIYDDLKNKGLKVEECDIQRLVALGRRFQTKAMIFVLVFLHVLLRNDHELYNRPSRR